MIFLLRRLGIFSPLGLLTRSCKGTRRHALEIMNNLVYLRDACFELTNIDMPINICALSSSWLGVRYWRLPSAIAHIRVLHSSTLQDPFLSSVFHGNIVFYSTAYIGHIRFTTTDYAKGKTADDSSIVFNVGPGNHFGRIQRIFKVNDAEPLFYVHTVSNFTEFRCATSSKSYEYPDICIGSLRESESYVFISAKDIVEKCVYYQNTEDCCTFYRFPNLQESS